MPGPGPSHRPRLAHAPAGPPAGPGRHGAAAADERRAPARPAHGDPLPGAGAADGAVGPLAPAGPDHPPVPPGTANAALSGLIRVDLHLHSRYSPDSGTS